MFSEQPKDISGYDKITAAGGEREFGNLLLPSCGKKGGRITGGNTL
jgi:hypothetical protein